MFVQTHTRPVDLANEWPVTVELQRAPWSKQSPPQPSSEPEPLVLGPDEDTREVARVQVPQG